MSIKEIWPRFLESVPSADSRQNIQFCAVIDLQRWRTTRPLIKPRTWNIPEHSGTSNNFEKNMLTLYFQKWNKQNYRDWYQFEKWKDVFWGREVGRGWVGYVKVPLWSNSKSKILITPYPYSMRTTIPTGKKNHDYYSNCLKSPQVWKLDSLKIHLPNNN